ncbi:MAG: MerR family transcriptional regulator [Acidobacteria bacterium]|nr:MerR family transcriptional regulator [Acidobacteriota bacterium]MBI3664285.1 MerR family transcriptional regulator [Acidobacteriota bacterium]
MSDQFQRVELPQKNLFRIGEVSRLTATKPFVLRYWETEFPMLQPVKAPSGHRLYRREDIETVLEIKRLLYEEGFTIAGARKHLSEGGGHGGNGHGRSTAAASETPTPTPRGSTAHRKRLLELRDELQAILTLLKRG